MMTARDRATGAGADQGAAAEAYRILRSSVKFAVGEQPPRTVLVVDIDRQTPSSVADELAAAFARAGDCCALIDLTATGADRTGFADLLRGEATPAQIATPTEIDGLARVGAGDGFSPDLLASTNLLDALAALRDAYAYVIVSCAALPNHGDALAIAPRVDATILVVTSGKTRRPRAIEARDALERVGARLLGVVLVEARRRLFW